jgi:hypothetical protein
VLCKAWPAAAKCSLNSFLVLVNSNITRVQK